MFLKKPYLLKKPIFLKKKDFRRPHLQKILFEESVPRIETNWVILHQNKQEIASYNDN